MPTINMSSVSSATTSMSMVPISNSTNAPWPSCFNSSRTQEVGPKTLLQNIDYLLTGPLLFSVIIIGLITNAFCLFVFGRSFRAVRIHFYLLVLAMWDVSLEIGAFFMFALPTVLYGDVVLYGEYSQVFPFFYFLSNVARNGSVWIVVTVALERYFALCYPYKFQLWNTEKRVYILLSLVSFLAFIYGLPRFFELKSEECRHPDTSLIVPRVAATVLRGDRLYWLIYRVAGGFIFYSIGPFLLLTFLTIRISMEIGRSQTRLRETTRKNGRRESQLYRFIKRLRDDENGNGEGGDKQNVNHWMHVAVITKFLIFHSAPTVLDICGLINKKLLLSEAGFVAGHASNLMVVLNSSCNFFIYLRTSTHFKRDLSDCLRRRKPHAAYFL